MAEHHANVVSVIYHLMVVEELLGVVGERAGRRLREVAVGARRVLVGVRVFRVKASAVIVIGVAVDCEGKVREEFDVGVTACYE